MVYRRDQRDEDITGANGLTKTYHSYSFLAGLTRCYHSGIPQTQIKVNLVGLPFLAYTCTSILDWQNNNIDVPVRIRMQTTQ